ncbi:MAG: ribose-phosphate diphosphokinase [Proteobacteria bacterium]|nr:ribose-phosphate diphosphokinase [Pseudomonadota bacterium]MBU4295627.1 ribose-phosphate diphosphokinase [Pseudomonadota bacterium]MCG2746818.1 ribose-phosphate diphosphokinase [Desulfobulbaceae bacterium]
MSATNDDKIIISNEASEALGRRIAQYMDIPFTRVLKKFFTDGEIYHAFPEDFSGRDVIIVGATPNDESHLELIDLIDGCHYYRARTVNVVIPYLGYSTMEQAKPDANEIPKGITRTRQIFRARPDFVAFIDLHSEAVLHAHHGDVQTLHINTHNLIVQKIRELKLSNFVLVSPDYGRSKWVARLAGQLNAPHTAADKDRYAMDKTMVHQVASVVKDKLVIICDDMIRTGGSIIQTALRCREAGARDVILFATHLVLAGQSRQKFKENGIVKIIGADTYPGVESDELLDVFSVAPLVASTLKRHLGAVY